MIDISQYSSFFHDGSIYSIIHQQNEMLLTLESAEIDEDDLEDNIALSIDDRIRGVLHIEGIKEIKENKKLYKGIYEKKLDDATIFHLKLEKNRAEFQIIWQTLPPNLPKEDFSTIIIEAQKIWWENIPDLKI